MSWGKALHLLLSQETTTQTLAAAAAAVAQWSSVCSKTRSMQEGGKGAFCLGQWRCRRRHYAFSGASGSSKRLAFYSSEGSHHGYDDGTRHRVEKLVPSLCISYRQTTSLIRLYVLWLWWYHGDLSTIWESPLWSLWVCLAAFESYLWAGALVVCIPGLKPSQSWPDLLPLPLSLESYLESVVALCPTYHGCQKSMVILIR